MAFGMSYFSFWGHLFSFGGISLKYLPPKMLDSGRYYSTMLDTRQQKAPDFSEAF
jgi:hypothetical protein